jgi:hypothetical protein
MGFSPSQGVQISTLRLCLLRKQEEERNKVRRHTVKGREIFAGEITGDSTKGSKTILQPQKISLFLCFLIMDFYIMDVLFTGAIAPT